MAKPAATVSAVLREAVSLLIDSSETPTIDARVLLEYVTGLDHAAILAAPDRTLDEATLARFRALLERRRAGEPIAYITGRREFWSLDLEVTPDTLIPRPETELLAERALQLVPADARWDIADLGTGSGAIALSIASERPHCQVLATDRSDAALAVARRNAARLRIANIEFSCGPWCEALGERLFDLIASNPPYVADDDPHLREGDVRFEPVSALRAGPAGLDELKTIIDCARSHLKPGGWLLLEHGYDQGEAVRALLADGGYDAITTHADLAGHERFSEACIK
jgi:release factor glutamine methyltransferase